MAEAEVTPRPEWNEKGADHDQAYRFGAPGQLVNEIARGWLLLLRGRIKDGDFDDDIHPDEGKGETDGSGSD